ncbi:MAG: hypothetical protein LBG61_06440 [Burkholderiales bacterium]|jgi:hypothetical protein|nr:hypothetical protein [Burkholderiales bacterium]
MEKRKNTVLRGKVTAIERNVIGAMRDDVANACKTIPMLITLENSARIEFSDEADFDIGDDVIILAERNVLTHRLNSYLFNAYYNVTKKVSYIRSFSTFKIGGVPALLTMPFFLLCLIVKALANRTFLSYVILVISVPSFIYCFYSVYKADIEKDYIEKETIRQLNEEINKLQSEDG